MPAATQLLELGIEENHVPFEIHTMEWLEQNRWQQNALPHRHNYFVIIWVKDATGTHIIDFESHQITGNTIYCLSPGQVHLLRADEGAKGYVLSFTSGFFCLAEDNYDLLFNRGLFYSFSGAGIIHPDAQMKEELQDVVDKMIKEYNNFFLLRSEILRGYLKIFLIYLSRQAGSSTSAPHHSKTVELVKHFLTLLEKNFTVKKMVSDYAQELAVTPNYLNEIVKKVSGFPASEHIRQRVVLEAKRKAIYSDVSMKEIAYALGFEDVAHFSKYFKNASGINFTDFKKDAAAMFSL